MQDSRDGEVQQNSLVGQKHLTEPDPLILMIGHGADDP